MQSSSHSIRMSREISLALWRFEWMSSSSMGFKMVHSGALISVLRKSSELPLNNLGKPQWMVPQVKSLTF